jgi:hypothetical protein
VQIAAWAYYLAAPLWFVRRLVPWSGLISALAFTAVLGLNFERENELTHSSHLLAQMLWLYAVWYAALAGDIRTSAGRLWSLPPYPRWVTTLSAATVGWFYTLAGLSKLGYSGLAWANGLSLQLWIARWGTDSPVSHWLQSNREAAQGLQAASLALELLALPLALWPRTRWLIGAGLLGLHTGISMVYPGHFFWANMAIIVLTLLPVWRFVGTWATSGEPDHRLDCLAHRKKGVGSQFTPCPSAKIADFFLSAVARRQNLGMRLTGWST